jgi:hypothetical protein
MAFSSLVIGGARRIQPLRRDPVIVSTQYAFASSYANLHRLHDIVLSSRIVDAR